MQTQLGAVSQQMTSEVAIFNDDFTLDRNTSTEPKRARRPQHRTSGWRPSALVQVVPPRRRTIKLTPAQPIWSRPLSHFAVVIAAHDRGLLVRFTEILHGGLAKAKVQGCKLQVEGLPPEKVTTFGGARIYGPLVLDAAYVRID